MIPPWKRARSLLPALPRPRPDRELLVPAEGGPPLARLGSRLRRGWHDLVGSGRATLRQLPQAGITSNKVWLASFTALGTADVASMSSTLAPWMNGIGAVGLGGAAGLIITAIHDLRRSKDSNQRLDAASDLIWGAQGLVSLGLPAAGAFDAVAVQLGVAGALVQTTVGVLRIRAGIKQRDNAMVKLGALDLGGGLLWLGWDLVGMQQPLYIGSYVVLMVGREAYANRAALQRIGRRTKERARLVYDGLTVGLNEILAEAWNDIRAAAQLGAGQLSSK